MFNVTLSALGAHSDRPELRSRLEYFPQQTPRTTQPNHQSPRAYIFRLSLFIVPRIMAVADCSAGALIGKNGGGLSKAEGRIALAGCSGPLFWREERSD
jgi:hypothetical protein